MHSTRRSRRHECWFSCQEWEYGLDSAGTVLWYAVRNGGKKQRFGNLPALNKYSREHLGGTAVPPHFNWKIDSIPDGFEAVHVEDDNTERRERYCTQQGEREGNKEDEDGDVNDVNDEEEEKRGEQESTSRQPPPSPRPPLRVVYHPEGGPESMVGGTRTNTNTGSVVRLFIFNGYHACCTVYYAFLYSISLCALVFLAVNLCLCIIIPVSTVKDDTTVT